jgi:dGTPase
LGETRDRIVAAAPTRLDEVRAAPPLVAFSIELRHEADELKRFLFDHLYRHYQVMRMTGKARRVVTELFDAFMAEPRLLPPDHSARAAHDRPRAIADYVAGMTDRYAIKEHRRLFAIGES